MPKKAGGTKKIGRNKEKCKQYKTNHTKEKNKIRKLRKQIKHLPENNLHRSILEKRIRELKRILKGEDIDA